MRTKNSDELGTGVVQSSPFVGVHDACRLRVTRRQLAGVERPPPQLRVGSELRLVLVACGGPPLHVWTEVAAARVACRLAPAELVRVRVRVRVRSGLG